MPRVLSEDISGRWGQILISSSFWSSTSDYRESMEACQYGWPMCFVQSYHPENGKYEMRTGENVTKLRWNTGKWRKLRSSWPTGRGFRFSIFGGPKNRSWSFLGIFGCFKVQDHYFLLCSSTNFVALWCHCITKKHNRYEMQMSFSCLKSIPFKQIPKTMPAKTHCLGKSGGIRRSKEAGHSFRSFPDIKVRKARKAQHLYKWHHKYFLTQNEGVLARQIALKC